MKTTNLIIIVIAVMVFAIAAKMVANQNQAQPENVDIVEVNEVVAETPTVIDIIHQRKSVRHFTDQKVSKEDLLTLVKAGMASPTAMDKRPWAFFILDERSALDSLANVLPYAGSLKEASAAIIVCGDLDRALPGDGQVLWTLDCALASQNILLAAESMGLGAVFTAVYPFEDRETPVSTVLGLPDNLRPLNVIPVGYPTGEDKPKDKWDETRVYFNKYEKR